MNYVEKLYKLAPPTVECFYTHQELNSLERLNLKRLSDLLSEVKTGLRENELLDTEIQSFRIFAYKVEDVLRNDKQLIALKKVKRCIRRLMEMNLPETAEKINQQLKASYHPLNFKMKNNKESGVNLPSRQQFEFLQVQIMATTQLIVCTLKAIATAHKFGLQKIYLGHFLPLNILTSSALSRLWVLLKYYLLKCVELYQTVGPITTQLKGTPTQWFPADEKFPILLNEWLGFDRLEELPV
ncbi:hypothetical protein CHUAL_000220 [Chamberlinius hualienensis]